ncbi:MAG: GAP family protein [Actinomycetia bacterium]|nr:GAP family protein [Actinomycetes bacterium]
MWITLLAIAVAVSLEPFRIGMTILMINRPRPALQLLAFLAGGFLMGTAVGVIVLFVLRPAVESAHLSLPKVHIVVGAILLINAVFVVTGLPGGKRNSESPGLVVRIMEALAARARRLLTGRSLWVAGIAGLGIALPSIDFFAALALIVASGSAAAIQFGALIGFNIVAFALVEIPLLCYLVAPERTRATLEALHRRLRSNGRLGVATLIAVIGCVLLGVGIVAM